MRWALGAALPALVLLQVACAGRAAPSVSTPLGVVVGSTRQSLDGPADVYLGLPYTDEVRSQAPQAEPLGLGEEELVPW